MNINKHNVAINHLPSNIFGLVNIPQMIDFDNDADWLPFTKSHTTEVTKKSFDVVESICKNYMTDAIMEIGVSRNGDGSFTNAILKNKPDNIPYLGVDVENKSYLQDPKKNIYTIQAKSEEQLKIRKHMQYLNINKLSILFIDGWHSLNTVINDWRYTDLLSHYSVVFLHDTNGHPGPTIILESIDKDIFNIKKYFENDDDYGLSIAVKKVL